MKKIITLVTAAVCCMISAGCNVQKEVIVNDSGTSQLGTADMMLYVKYGEKIYWEIVSDTNEVKIESLKGDKVGETVYKDLDDVNKITSTEDIKDFPNLSSNAGAGMEVYKVKGENDKLIIVYGENSGKMFKAD